MKVSLIVPCYNEQESLPVFYEEMMKIVKKMSCQYELIFINDGSKDRTLSILKKFQLRMTMLHIFLFQEILEKKLQCMRVFAMQMQIM